MATDIHGIVQYLRHNQQTFREKPFNPVDSLILSTLTYLEMEVSPAIVEGSFERVKLHDILALTDWEKLKVSGWIAIDPSTPLFMLYAMASRRLRDVELVYLKTDISEDAECQFGAVTFIIPTGETLLTVRCSDKTFTAQGYREKTGQLEKQIDEMAYVCYRGTDNSFVGWREDFNLSFMDVIPAQVESEQYLNTIAQHFDGPLLLGGHSKGGNLAEYASAVASPDVFNRIVTSFNHDGPAFLNKPSERYADKSFFDMHFKMVPESSLVGMLLENGEDYHVVDSSAMGGILQHVPYTWQCDDDDFKYMDGLNAGASIFDDSVQAWLKTHSVEDRGRVVDTVFDMIDKTGAKTVGDLGVEKRKKLTVMATELSQMDPETRSLITSIMASLFSCIKDETTNAIAAEISQAAPFQMAMELLKQHAGNLPGENTLSD